LKNAFLLHLVTPAWMNRKNCFYGQTPGYIILKLKALSFIVLALTFIFETGNFVQRSIDYHFDINEKNYYNY